MTSQAEQWFREAVALHHQGRLQDSAKLYERSLGADPNNADALHLLGLVSLQAGEVERGAQLIERSLAIRPNHPEALSNLGIAYRRLARSAEALGQFDRAIAINPKLIDAHVNRAGALLDLAQPQEALEAFDRVLELNPRHPQAHCNRGAALQILKRPGDALAAFDRATALAPNMAEAHANRANVLRELDRAPEALEASDRALALQHQSVSAHIYRAYALLDLRRTQEALESFERALALQPQNPLALVGRGRGLFECRMFEEAIASFDAAIARAPTLPQPHLRRAIALYEAGRYDEAAAGATRALEISPDLYAAYICRANALQELGLVEEALRDHEVVCRLWPDLDYALGHYIHAKATLCDWDGFDDLTARLFARIEAGEAAAYPFVLLEIAQSPALLLKGAALHARSEKPALGVSTPLAGVARGERIKIGYFSSDFYDHPVAHLVWATMANHDRARFEVFAFSFSRRHDQVSERVRQACDHFIDVSGLTTAQIVDRSRALGIDVAVDLNGYTKDARTDIFATRAAPVQMSYLGYLGSMGGDFMDYLIADAQLIPAPQRPYYSEKLVMLPWYQCNDESANAPITTRLRAEYGLPDDAFVFASFNNAFKVSPTMFSLWMRVLERAPASVLWFYAGNQIAARNISIQATKHGISANRIVYAERAPRQEHLARQRLADLMLDTSPYNGGATTSNALRAGVAVLTLAGQTFASRMSASLLSALELSELIANSPSAYEDMAVYLAHHPQALAALKQKTDVAPMSKLFNAKAIARHLESAYALAVQSVRAGEPFQDIIVPNRGL